MRAARWPVLAWVVLITGALWITATRLSVHSELGDLLPEGTTATQRVLLTQVRSGLAGRLMLLAIEGSPQDELARLSKALGEGLRGHPQIDFVGNGMQALSPEERQVVFRSRYLLSRTAGADTFSADSLHVALEQRLDDLRSPLAPMIKIYSDRSYRRVSRDPPVLVWMGGARNTSRSLDVGRSPSCVVGGRN